MKKFDIPKYYRSSIISRIKEMRKVSDPRKQDYSPTQLDFGPVKFYIARHFGFCYGVENAIEIAYKTIRENSEKRIFLLSEMIHNPAVNEDLKARDVRFIMDTAGNQIIGWDELKENDVVIIPAFGTTLEIETILKKKKIDTVTYNTTCPFVEKVWKKARLLGKENYTVIIHGKHTHEETRATFSHSVKNSPSVIVRDIKEAKLLSDIILGKTDQQKFYSLFKGKHSEGFDVEKDLVKVGVVNQTTMLASETQYIAEHFKFTMQKKYGNKNINNHYADTRDTLCYATNDNQQATYGLLKEKADLAIVVGGYNSSNTSHLVELLEQKFKTYFISSEENIISKSEIDHFDIHTKALKKSNSFIPDKEKVSIALTSGASCPDSVVDEVIKKILTYFDNVKNIDDSIKPNQPAN